jgi:hypothetical protein
MQQVEALVVGEERVGAMVEEEVHNVIVAALGRPQDGCSNGISAFCIDGCTGLYEVVAEGVVVVDSRPLHHMVMVSVRPCLVGYIMSIRTCSGVMPCSSLYVASNLPPSNSFCIAPISPNRANCIMSSSTGRRAFVSAIVSSSCSPVVSGDEDAEAMSEVSTRRRAASEGPNQPHETAK